MDTRMTGRSAVTVTTDEFNETPTMVLVQHAVLLAQREPVLESDDYWTPIRAFHRRSGREVFQEAVVLCSSPDTISRAIGADILAQIGR
jgi:hypothetical protein